MDEYADNLGRALSPTHPLSLKGIAHTRFLDRLPLESGIDMNQVFFPNELNLTQLETLIEDLGGIYTTFGGIGIHGHIAFNEPVSNISELGVRLVDLNPYTITINAIRAKVGGDVENIPHQPHIYFYIFYTLRKLLGSCQLILCL